MGRLILILFFFTVACKEAYDPPVVSTNHAYLVVEGFINSGPDSTLFILSRSFKLNDSTRSAPPELNAVVSVQGSDNTLFPLGEMGNGRYGAMLTLNNALQYRLEILTSDGKHYQSDYVPLKTSPPIDSINWTDSHNGLQLYVNTHDPQNASHYYRWDYSETWQFHSVYASSLEYIPEFLQSRLPNDIYYCWKTAPSTTIILGNTAKLSQDLIYEAPLELVPPDSWKISVEYSILVKQYVLTQDAYAFWLNLQTNTEQIGSIFSPEPSTTHGNLHCVNDPTEQALGYVGGGTVSQQRIFITPDQIPRWTAENYPNSCVQMTTPAAPPNSLASIFGNGVFIPVDYSDPLDDSVFYVPTYCGDCTKIGSNVKPTFWP
jgi:Domain of unknown function (DUF4249)